MVQGRNWLRLCWLPCVWLPGWFAVALMASRQRPINEEHSVAWWLSPSSSPSGYWREICKRSSASRPPIITLVFVVAIVTVFYVANEGSDQGPIANAMMYIPGGSEWYRSLSASYSHVSEGHLWMNVTMLLILGSFYELTEGLVNTFCVLWGGSNLGFAFHGVLSASTVRGASAAVYAVLFAQLSLLILNWSEMPFRLLRVLVIVVLTAIDVGVFWLDPEIGISYSSHFFGALAGICIALVLGRNVILRRFEVTLSWAGVLGYSALCVVAVVNDQLSAGLLAASILPGLGWYAAVISTRAKALPPGGVEGEVHVQVDTLASSVQQQI